MTLAAAEWHNTLVKKCQDHAKKNAPPAAMGGKRAKATDLGKLPLLSHVLYMGVLNSMIDILRYISLFPCANKEMATTVPVLDLMCDCLVLNNQARQQEFDAMIELASQANAFSSITSRILRPKTFKNAKSRRISLLPWFFHMGTLQLKQQKDQAWIFTGGLYYGCYQTKPDSPWDNLNLLNEAHLSDGSIAPELPVKSWNAVRLIDGSEYVFATTLALGTCVMKTPPRVNKYPNGYVREFKKWKEGNKGVFVDAIGIFKQIVKAKETKAAKLRKKSPTLKRSELVPLIKTLGESLSTLHAQHAHVDGTPNYLQQFTALAIFVGVDSPEIPVPRNVDEDYQLALEVIGEDGFSSSADESAGEKQKRLFHDSEEEEGSDIDGEDEEENNNGKDVDENTRKGNHIF